MGTNMKTGPLGRVGVEGVVFVVIDVIVNKLKKFLV